MMKRRQFLGGVMGSGASLLMPSLLAGCGSSNGLRAPDGQTVAFHHGVASGDPLADRVILWTRVTPAVDAPIGGRWQLALDPEFRSVIRWGDFATDAARDYTVKIDADGLSPDSWYYYRFEAGGVASPVGRTRTLPVGRVERLRLAYTSCSNYPAGYFTVYRAMAERNDIDVVLHLGDYIYEYGEGEYGALRSDEPRHEITSLEDYRTRHGIYKTDADLQEIHRQYPMIVVWDDHESTNNSWRDGAENHTEGEEGIWAERKAWSVQAFYEWLPIRVPDPVNDPYRIWRSFQFGDLVDLIMLDTRLYDRDEQTLIPLDPRRLDEGRRLLGPVQQAWLEDQLRGSKTVWQLLGQQVMFGQLRAATLPDLGLLGQTISTELISLNMDQWDGYVAARTRVFNAIEDAGLRNVVVLTGDIHSSWGIELYRNPGALLPLVGGVVGSVTELISKLPVVGDLLDSLTATLLGERLINVNLGPRPTVIEFVCPSVTSPGLPAPLTPVLQGLFKVIDPHIKYFQGDLHGYVLLDITRDQMQTEWHYVDSITSPEATATMGQSVVVQTHEGRIRPGGPATWRAPNPSRAP